MRGNPGERVHPDIEIFPWSEAEVVTTSSSLGLSLCRPAEKETIEDARGNQISRRFWIYRKN